MVNTINWSRLLLAFFLAPAIGSLTAHITFLGYDGFANPSNVYGFNLLGIIGASLLMSFFGLLIIYPYMLFCGLPVIFMMEKLRLNKIISYILYCILIGCFPVVSFKVANLLGMDYPFKNDLAFLSFKAILVGAITSIFMLCKRDDWR